MSDSKQALFFDPDPDTGQMIPTTYESMHAGMLRWHPTSDRVPEDIQELLHTAIDYFALAYEQANTGRMHLYQRLTNDAFTKAVLALELALRRRLGRGNSVTLEKLIQQGIEDGLLPATDEYKALWTELRENRNAITHGDSERSSYGPSTARWIALVINAINAMYVSKVVEPSTHTDSLDCRI
jgi:hypothetical protein